jgi:hypothetical protein
VPEPARVVRGPAPDVPRRGLFTPAMRLPVRGANERAGLHTWSSAPRAKLRTRSASVTRPVSTITGRSGSIREARPSACRTRSSRSRPLLSSGARSGTTRLGRRTSIARIPSPRSSRRRLETRPRPGSRAGTLASPRRPPQQGSAVARP